MFKLVTDAIATVDELAGGGEYSVDDRGTIYTDLSGYEWVHLADESFVRLY